MVTSLGNVLFAQEKCFTLDEMNDIISLTNKAEKLMKILLILENKSKSKDMLVNALRFLVHKDGQKTWFPDLLEKVLISKADIK